MTDEVISFFNCTQVSREDQISVMPAAVEECKNISIAGSVQTAYTYMEAVARKLARWITVTAENVRRTVVRTVCAFVRNAVCTSGVQILRKIAILRF